jgi:hypothetical protein
MPGPKFSVKRKPVLGAPLERPFSASFKSCSYRISHVSPSLEGSSDMLTSTLENMGPQFLADLERNLQGETQFKMNVCPPMDPLKPSADTRSVLCCVPVSDGGTGKWRRKCWACFLVDRKTALELEL